MSERLPDFVRDPLEALMRDSAGNRAMTLCLALSYGGRESIVSTTRALCELAARGALKPEEVTEERFSAHAADRRHAPARSADPHLGRGAAVELPALGGGLRRALLHRDPVARLRQGGVPARARVVSAAASAASAAPASRSGRTVRPTAPLWLPATFCCGSLSAVVGLPLLAPAGVLARALGVRLAGAAGRGGRPWPSTAA